MRLGCRQRAGRAAGLEQRHCAQRPSLLGQAPPQATFSLSRPQEVPGQRQLLHCSAAQWRRCRGSLSVLAHRLKRGVQLQ